MMNRMLGFACAPALVMGGASTASAVKTMSMIRFPVFMRPSPRWLLAAKGSPSLPPLPPAFPACAGSVALLFPSSRFASARGGGRLTRLAPLRRPEQDAKVLGHPGQGDAASAQSSQRIQRHLIRGSEAGKLDADQTRQIGHDPFKVVHAFRIQSPSTITTSPPASRSVVIRRVTPRGQARRGPGGRDRGTIVTSERKGQSMTKDSLVAPAGSHERSRPIAICRDSSSADRPQLRDRCPRGGTGG